MSVWIEIHCDVKSKGPPNYIAIEPYCDTERGAELPCVLTYNTAAHTVQCLNTLAMKARDLGWIKTRKHGWVCPRCRKMLPKDGAP